MRQLMKRPWVKTRCVADTYADHLRERIVEFEGGLISLRRDNDGAFTVAVYKLDPNVRVTVDPSRVARRSRAEEG